MASITIEFTFENSVTDEYQIKKFEFELDSCIEDSVQEYQDEYMEDNDLGDDWDCTSEEVVDVYIDGDDEADEARYGAVAGKTRIGDIEKQRTAEQRRVHQAKKIKPRTKAKSWMGT